MTQSAPKAFGLFELDLAGTILYSGIDESDSSTNLPPAKDGYQLNRGEI